MTRTRLTGLPAPVARHETIAAALAAAARHPSGVTFVGRREEETSLPWAAVHRRALRVAGALGARGVKPGDRVAIVLRTEPAFLDAFFGTLLAGAVPVPLYPPVRLGRMEEYLAATARMMRVSGARIAVASPAVRRILGEAVRAARPALALGVVDAGELAGGPEFLVPGGPGDLALVQFSSGSTVDPKPVALTQANIVAQVEALTQLVEPTSSDVLVSWLPLYHDMGLIGCLLGAMSYPGPLVLIPPEHFLARPALWLRAIARHRGTISAAPHFAYGYAADRVGDEDLRGLSLASWRIALDGAEPVTASTLRRFAARFARHGLDPGALMPVYGLSEAALAVTFSPRGRSPRVEALDPQRLAAGEIAPGLREVLSVGTPIPGVELEVRAEAGQPLPERRLGRIHVRGPSVMQGYLGDDAGTARVLAGGWLDTGDLGFHAGGELFVHGRAKDVVIVHGANHAPDEFESCLVHLPGVRPGCAVALGFVPPGGDGEELLLLVERAPGSSARDEGLAEAVRRAVLERTGVRAHTISMLAPGTLPRTSSGKMRRAEALRRYHSGALRPPARVSALSMTRHLLRSGLAYARSRR
ncbi:MAG TPA: fatty acyl-AMP ligase [Anaeromyxobacteraceae bacterium]|nr:fatty acyl-AMP ligase [Anaeromyxobacteraceae bacterium]